MGAKQRPTRSSALLLLGAMVAWRTIAYAPVVGAHGLQESRQPVAFVGATVLDGNGGPPIADGIVLIAGERIVAVGPRGAVVLPEGTRTIDASGKYVTPGFIDTNVHLSLYFGEETIAKYGDRHTELVVEGAQMALKLGVTTVRDSYGVLGPLKEARDAIGRGDEIGARMLVAGNIVGWGGSFSISMSLHKDELTLHQELINDAITQGSGEEWMEMYPDELRVAVNEYLDQGPDFIKYGGTSHFGFPNFLIFSPRAQRIIVEEAHKRGLAAETHANSPEGLLMALQAGVDLVQHPEHLAGKELSREILDEFVARGTICSMLTNAYTGIAWEQARKRFESSVEEQGEDNVGERGTKSTEAQGEESAEEARQETLTSLRRTVERQETSAERRSKKRDFGSGRRNAQKLIEAGCVVTVGTDSYLGEAPEFSRTPGPVWLEPGVGTIMGIEGLVELGMTPAEAIVSATRNGALACRTLEELGTLEAGKIADLLMLEADPLADIHNIRRLSLVMKAGQIIDTDALPTREIFYIR